MNRLVSYLDRYQTNVKEIAVKRQNVLRIAFVCSNKSFENSALATAINVIPTQVDIYRQSQPPTLMPLTDYIFEVNF